MIKPCGLSDAPGILEVINDGARAYQGIIPEDCWHEPYMSETELLSEMQKGVIFWGFYEGDLLLAVMGHQDVKDVTLIRHAYVRSLHRRKGLGGLLLKKLLALSSKKILIGTWAAASWAISFYQARGFQLVSDSKKTELLKKYWTVSQRQSEMSVVLEKVDS